MCGLIGTIAINKNAIPVSKESVEIARDTMRNRGPDAAGFWKSPDDHVILAHRRLSIIDLSTSADQPFVSSDEKFALVYNGEIYNYKELKQELISKGHKFKTSSDTEVLFIACKEYGAGVCKHLRGMFAFAFWNNQTQTLLLARDHFGIKPLYVAQDKGRVYFSSQVSAMLSLQPALQNEQSIAGHAGFFLWGHIPSPFTLYKKIKSVLPGQVICISTQGQIKENRYFSIGDILSGKKKSNYKIDSAASAIQECINAHMIADVPIGVFLSSGIDSSVIASAAAIKNSTKTITLGFPELAGTPKDETVAAKNIARILKSEHIERWVSRSNFSECLNEVINSMDQPTIDGINTFFICREAKAAGLKVVLSGIGGDEMFRGYSSFQDVLRLYQFVKKLGSFSKPVGYLVRKALWPLVGNSTKYKYAATIELGHNLESAYFLRRGLYMPWEIESLFGAITAKDAIEELAAEDYLRNELALVNDPVLKVQLMELLRYMSDRLLRDSDWASMAHSIELRVPFVDKWILATIADAALEGRTFVKSDLSGVMPEEVASIVFNRPKTGFNIPVQQWLNPETANKKLTLKNWAKDVYIRKTGTRSILRY